MVKNGYKIPFLDIPSSVIIRNNASSRENPLIVEREIRKLLKLGCVSEVSEVPKVVNPLTVSFNNPQKPRLVLDCRHINLFIFKHKFRMEDTGTARNMFKSGDFLLTFDLKSAYHHVEICKEQRTYLGFAWNFEGVGIKYMYFIFNVLPFGINSAAYIFTKTLRPVVKHWRSKGIKCIMYLDDGICGCSSFQKAVEISQIIQYDLKKLGFLLAQEKCSWEPSQEVIWLGLLFNTKTGTVKITYNRIEKFLCTASVLITNVSNGYLSFPVRKLASIAGQIQSFKGAIGYEVSLRSRYMLHCINSRVSWNSNISIDSQTLDEVVYWFNNCRKLNGRSFQDNTVCTRVAYSDASGQGFGGYVAQIEGTEMCGSWTAVEARQSTTWRELEAVKLVLLTLVNRLEGHGVQWVTDNLNVVHIIQKGSMNLVLLKISIEIQNVCRKN